VKKEGKPRFLEVLGSAPLTLICDGKKSFIYPLPWEIKKSSEVRDNPLLSFAIAVSSSLVTETMCLPISLDASKLYLNPEICGKRPSRGSFLLTPFSRVFHKFSPVIKVVAIWAHKGWTANVALCGLSSGPALVRTRIVSIRI
jgi:hypothetical protein